MEIVKLPVEVREKVGSAEARRIRRSGRLPIVLYGMDRPTANFIVDARRFDVEFKRGRRMFELTRGDKTQVSLLKDVGYDSLGDTPVHADFVRIDDTKPVTLTVAIEFVGLPAPVTGAVLDIISRDLHVSCLPREVPESIQVQLGGLGVGHHIEAGTVTLPKGVTLADNPAKTIVTFHYKSAEVAAAPAEGTAAEPVVLTERKPTDDKAAGSEKKK